jgi:hypothetical protein
MQGSFLADWKQAGMFIHGVSFVFFMGLLAFLGYDMLAVFIQH